MSAIAVKGLVKRFGDIAAVDGIALDVPTGKCVGILGPNGAGKTTTIEILEGLQTPTAGEVTVLGRTWDKSWDELRQRIGVQLQETRFFDRITVEETLRLFQSFMPRGASMGIEQALAMVQLGPKRGEWVMNLSGGQRQRLALATALIGQPEIIFLDEPTTGLDPQSRAAVWDVVTDLKKAGRTLLLTTHYMEEAERLCDFIYIFDRGRVIAEGTPRELIAKYGGKSIVELVTQPRLTAEQVAALPDVSSASPSEDGWVLKVDQIHRAVAELLRATQALGVDVQRMATFQPTMNEVFLALTGRSLREDEAESGQQG